MSKREISEASVVPLVLKLSHEMTFVDFLVHQLLGHAGHSQLLVLFGTDLLLLDWVSHRDILLDALHHSIELLEVNGVEGQVWVHVVTHFHDVLSVGLFVNLTTYNSEMERCEPGGTPLEIVSLAYLLLRGFDVGGCVKGVRDSCHL